MLSRFIPVFVLLRLSVQLVAASNPACLLAAVNTQQNPGDLQTICGVNKTDVEAEISNVCGAEVEMAMNAFSSVCGGTSASTSSMSAIFVTAPMTGTSSITTTAPAALTGTTFSPASPVASVSTGGLITYTSAYLDKDCSCTKSIAMTTFAAVGPIDMNTYPAAAITGPPYGMGGVSNATMLGTAAMSGSGGFPSAATPSTGGIMPIYTGSAGRLKAVGPGGALLVCIAAFL